jgi:hypothetical protein
MAELVEGIWKCKVLGGEAAADDRDVVKVRINVEILEGPDKGRRATYEDGINFKSAKYVVMSARAVGWRGQGKIEDTFCADVDAWIERTGGESTLEVEHILRNKGAKAGTYWGKPRSIGRKPRALVAPSQTASADAHEALMAAMAELEPDETFPPAETPLPADDLPF